MADKPPRYRQSTSWYSREYQLPVQTVKNMRKRDWPLDDPKALLAKIMATNRRKPPIQQLINIVNGQPGAPTGTRGSSQSSQNPPPESPSGQTKSEDVEHALITGLQAELKRLEAETAQSYANYQAELLPAEKLVKQKLYLANVTALTRLAKDAPKADREASKTLPVSDVESAWSRSIKEFRSECEALPRRLATNSLFKKVDPVDVEELLMQEVQLILTHLETGSFLVEEPAA